MLLLQGHQSRPDSQHLWRRHWVSGRAGLGFLAAGVGMVIGHEFTFLWFSAAVFYGFVRPSSKKDIQDRLRLAGTRRTAFLICFFTAIYMIGQQTWRGDATCMCRTGSTRPPRICRCDGTWFCPSIPDRDTGRTWLVSKYWAARGRSHRRLTAINTLVTGWC